VPAGFGLKPATVSERNGRVWLRMHCDVHSPDTETLVSKDAAFFRRMLQFTEVADRDARSGRVLAATADEDESDSKLALPASSSESSKQLSSSGVQKPEIKFVEPKDDSKDRVAGFDPHALIPGLLVFHTPFV
jgi:hypothetical protein